MTAVVTLALLPAGASSHREAPLLAGDPLVDSTDVYAFVSPDKPDTVTLMSSWIPFEEPAGGPNFYKFEDGTWYDINVDNDGDAQPDYIYRWVFRTQTRSGQTFLYNTGPVTSLDDTDLNVVQTYTLQIIYKGTVEATIGPVRTLYNNVGAPSTPNYFGNGTGIEGFSHPGGAGAALTFSGQTDDPFFLDLRVFNLLYGANLSQAGRDTLRGFNVHTTAVQVPKAALRRGSSSPVIGVWTTASRQATRVFNADGTQTNSGNFVQVSRLGMPLVNEVVIPIGMKDRFSASKPADDAQFLPFVQTSEVANLLQLIYGLRAPTTPRNDLVSVFLTGVPSLNQPPNVRRVGDAASQHRHRTDVESKPDGRPRRRSRRLPKRPSLDRRHRGHRGAGGGRRSRRAAHQSRRRRRSQRRAVPCVIPLRRRRPVRCDRDTSLI